MRTSGFTFVRPADTAKVGIALRREESRKTVKLLAVDSETTKLVAGAGTTGVKLVSSKDGYVAATVDCGPIAIDVVESAGCTEGVEMPRRREAPDARTL